MIWFKISMLMVCMFPSLGWTMELTIINTSFGRLFTSQVFRDRSINTEETTIVVDLSDYAQVGGGPDKVLIPKPSPSEKRKVKVKGNWRVTGYATQANGDIGVWLKELKSGKLVFKTVDKSRWSEQDHSLDLHLDGKNQKLKPGILLEGVSQSAVKRYEVRQAP